MFVNGIVGEVLRINGNKDYGVFGKFKKVVSLLVVGNWDVGWFG